MGYYIYGKRMKPINTKNNGIVGPDKTFRALDAEGIRVNRLSEAFKYETKEEAQEVLDKNKGKDGVIFEIRKAK